MGGGLALLSWPSCSEALRVGCLRPRLRDLRGVSLLINSLCGNTFSCPGVCPASPRRSCSQPSSTARNRAPRLSPPPLPDPSLLCSLLSVLCTLPESALLSQCFLTSIVLSCSLSEEVPLLKVFFQGTLSVLRSEPSRSLLGYCEEHTALWFAF